MRKDLSGLLWKIYAWVYDLVLLSFIPYRNLLHLVTDVMGCRQGWRILDAGCGTGNFIMCLKSLQNGAKVVGIDFSPAMLSRARAKVEKGKVGGVSLIEGDLNRPLPFPGEEFEGALCVNTLYAVETPAFLLGEIYRVLKKGGRFILVTPPLRPRLSLIFKEHILGLKEKAPSAWPLLLLGQAIWRVPFLVIFLWVNFYIVRSKSFHFFGKEELLSLVKQAGFQVDTISTVYGGQNLFLLGIKL